MLEKNFVVTFLSFFVCVSFFFCLFFFLVSVTDKERMGLEMLRPRSLTLRSPRISSSRLDRDA